MYPEPEVTAALDCACYRCGSPIFETVGEAVAFLDQASQRSGDMTIPVNLVSELPRNDLCGYCLHVSWKAADSP